jgi:hypothetical protein
MADLLIDQTSIEPLVKTAQKITKGLYFYHTNEHVGKAKISIDLHS